MTTPNGGQQAAAQALGSLLGQGMPFGAQSAPQGQPQATAAGQQQLDPQFLSALVPILTTVAQGIISQLNAPQGQPQMATAGQQQGVSPQFFGLPFLPQPSPQEFLRGMQGIGGGLRDVFGLSAPQGQPQAATAGQQQLNPQFLDVLLRTIPAMAEPIMRMIVQSAPQGQPSFAQPQGAGTVGAGQPMAAAGWR